MSLTQRQLVFKGMRGFRYADAEASLEDARRSPYFWWWSYLRLSKDYWWVCQRKGIADDQRLRRMYSDFGLVYEMTFAQWWERKGIALFSEQIALPAVRQLDPADLRLSKDLHGHLLLEVPLHLTERTIVAQVRRLVRLQPQRQVERISNARRPLAKLIGIRQDVIQTAYEVWRVHYQSRDGRLIEKIGQKQGTKSFYQIGKELRLVRTCMPAGTDDEAKAAKRVNGMKVAVSRMLTRANHLIVNATVGVFPSVGAMREPLTWRTVQKERLEQAVAEGVWRPLFSEEDVLIVP